MQTKNPNTIFATISQQPIFGTICQRNKAFFATLVSNNMRPKTIKKKNNAVHLATQPKNKNKKKQVTMCNNAK